MRGKNNDNPDPNQATISLLDAETVARLRSLAADVAEHDESVLLELFETFRKDAFARMEKMRAANQNGNLQEVSATLHSLKGASVTIGVAQLASLCRKLETTLAETQAPLPEAALQEFEACRDESLQALQDAFFRDTD